MVNKVYLKYILSYLSLFILNLTNIGEFQKLLEKSYNLIKKQLLTNGYI